MTSAIIVVGDEPGFLRHAQEFAVFLKKKSGVKKVSILKGAYTNFTQFNTQFSDTIFKEHRNSQNLLVAYQGHGSKEGWAINNQTVIPYNWVAYCVVRHRGSVLVINDTCYADALWREIPKIRLGVRLSNLSYPKQFGLISACAANETSRTMIYKVMDLWGRRRRFPRKQTIHWRTTYVAKGEETSTLVTDLGKEQYLVMDFTEARQGESGEQNETHTRIRHGAYLDRHFFAREASNG